MARCFVTRRLPGPALERLAARHEVDVWPARLPPTLEQLHDRAAPAHGLLCLLTDCVDAALIAACPNLRAISTYSVGYENIDLAAARACGIAVGHTPDVLTEATADLTWALMLAAARRLLDAQHAARSGDWLTWEPAAHLGFEVGGATLLIIGAGRIGSAVARRAAGFDMTVLHHGRDSPAPLHDLLSRADFVSLHCPLTPASHHLIDARALQHFKPTAILVNTARGAIVDQAALVQALHTGQIAGAALDVTDPEPPPPGDPILAAPNLLLAPHIGSATRAARERMAELAVDNLLAGIDGRPMPHAAPQ